uniref:Uncharacterized protein n=1 Tax=Arundo donax TaxID=35708 RepID=A0A0A9HD46_ARUDO
MWLIRYGRSANGWFLQQSFLHVILETGGGGCQVWFFPSLLIVLSA